MTKEELIELAHEMYGSDDVEIDNDATVSPAEGGSWVAAWLWVPKPEEEKA